MQLYLPAPPHPTHTLISWFVASVGPSSSVTGPAKVQGLAFAWNKGFCLSQGGKEASASSFVSGKALGPSKACSLVFM